MNKIMDEKIIKVWFSDNRIYIKTDKANVLSRPLEAFPLLKEASETQRQRFEIGLYADEIHWPDIDEDISIESFYETQEPDYDNDTAKIFKKYPDTNLNAVAAGAGIHKTLLQKYIYGIKKPSPERFNKIVNALKNFWFLRAEKSCISLFFRT